MFSRLSSVAFYVLFLFSALAVAVPVTMTNTVTMTAPGTTVTAPSGQCSVGDLQCCNSVVMANSESGSLLLGLLGIVLQDLNVLLGVNCSPISVIGVGGTGCTAAPVCCQNNTFNGLIAIGCSPIIINL
ncbi:fungal hydrophobin [Dendrothele bispora CBS 962.96]|uniref:Hydrophobin n=1 Tax=Dendrothele bispora (strain CBS 962.96) TaxID=1314807 RepID=A0A4S8M4G0_DENBC|nr:fungal hydrophobin [Dendrothele bispora CBS 962.96]